MARFYPRLWEGVQPRIALPLQLRQPVAAVPRLPQVITQQLLASRLSVEKENRLAVVTQPHLHVLIIREAGLLRQEAGLLRQVRVLALH